MGLALGIIYIHSKTLLENMNLFINKWLSFGDYFWVRDVGLCHDPLLALEPNQAHACYQSL